MPTINADFASSTIAVAVQVFDAFGPAIYLIIGAFSIAIALAIILQAIHK